ncbi:hypothetical protein KIH39_15115 [Telmatocola sphagniphila]|uniref:Uncharacterized protein n=1 Tax=Telmatocola sphagniphila TaxID=1123043 RepID=A0A8E6B424_9BACT|nr:hypothetical protein [Telmatocola sphagniphila]QVL30183.1 hypothetical protein KIH39_15115 [Telmatocola sphagniphila]
MKAKLVHSKKDLIMIREKFANSSCRAMCFCFAIITVGAVITHQQVRGDDCEQMLFQEPCGETFGSPCDLYTSLTDCESNIYSTTEQEEVLRTIRNSYSRVRMTSMAQLVCTTDYDCKWDGVNKKCKSNLRKVNKWGAPIYQQDGCDPNNPNAPWPVVILPAQPAEMGWPLILDKCDDFFSME